MEKDYLERYFENIDVDMERNRRFKTSAKVQEIEDKEIEFPSSTCESSKSDDVPFFEDIDQVLVKKKNFTRDINIYSKNNTEQERYYR